MRESQSILKSACSTKYAPVPESVRCDECLEDVEIWSDEEEAECASCGKIVKNNLQGG